MERFLTSRGPSRVGGWSSIFKRFLQSNGLDGQVQLQHHFFTSKVVPKHKQIPVLFIHGLLASGRTYRSFVKRKDFVPEREVYTIDLRNHGESPHAQRMDIRTLASDVLAFLDGQGLKQISLIGHSLGGKVAMVLALEFPERVKDLVVLDMPPGKTAGKMRNVYSAIQAMYNVDFHGLGDQRDVERVLEMNGIEDRRLRMFLLTNLTGTKDDTDDKKLSWKVNIQSIRDSVDQLQSFPEFETGTTYDKPALFAFGSKSPLSTAKNEEGIRSLFPEATVIEVAEAGHWLQDDEPKRTCAVVSSFLSDQGQQQQVS